MLASSATISAHAPTAWDGGGSGQAASIG